MARPSNRFSLKILMAFIASIAVGLGLMRDGSTMSNQVAFTTVVLALIVGLLGAVVNRGDGGWVGFALFGWSYFVMTCAPAMNEHFGNRLVTKQLLVSLVERLYNVPPEPPDLPFDLASPENGRSARKIVDGQWIPLTTDEFESYMIHVKASLERSDSYIINSFRIDRSIQIGQNLLATIFALVGLVVGRYLASKTRSVGWAPPTNSNPVGGAHPTNSSSSMSA